jgi:hypothetical protein
VKFDQWERAALTHAGFAVADDNKAAYVEALVVVGAHDDETYWLTISLPNETRIVCAMPRDEVIAAIMND